MKYKYNEVVYLRTYGYHPIDDYKPVAIIGINTNQSYRYDTTYDVKDQNNTFYSVSEDRLEIWRRQ